MAATDGDPLRTVTLSADRDRFSVVFEMLGHVVVVEPFESLRFVVHGETDAGLTIGYGQNGVSVFRDEGLQVAVYSHEGVRLDIPGW